MRLARTLTAFTLLGVVLSAQPARADDDIPPGFRVLGRTAVTTGVERLDLVRDKPPLAVHVARIAESQPLKESPSWTGAGVG